MVLNRVFPTAIAAARNISTSVVQQSNRSVVGANLPFQIKNRYRLAAVFILYFGSAMALPFLIVRHAILVKNSA